MWEKKGYYHVHRGLGLIIIAWHEFLPGRGPDYGWRLAPCQDGKWEINLASGNSYVGRHRSLDEAREAAVEARIKETDLALRSIEEWL